MPAFGIRFGMGATSAPQASSATERRSLQVRLDAIAGGVLLLLRSVVDAVAGGVLGAPRKGETPFRMDALYYYYYTIIIYTTIYN